ncbi:unnamed protein product [Alopecurus aequalis]
MSAVLRHAARKLGGSVAQRAEAAVAEGRGRLVTRRLYSTEESMTQGKKNLKDASDQVGATPGGFNWRQIPFASISQGVGAIGNTVIKGCLFFAVASQCDVDWLLGRDKQPEAKKRA